MRYNILENLGRVALEINRDESGFSQDLRCLNEIGVKFEPVEGHIIQE